MPPAHHAGAPGSALPPSTELVYDGADLQLTAAVAQLTAGDPGPLAPLLASTRATRDWDRRSHAVAKAAQATAGDHGPVRAWAQGAPNDPDAALLIAAAHLQLAWQARARRGADEPGAAGAFHTMLTEALPMVAHALAVGPGDPVTFEVAIDHARASSAAREVFYDLCQGAERADPMHLGWHSAALRFLSPRWHGSADEMWLYADAVSEPAPPAARVALLPALALSDIWRDDASRHGSAGGPGQAFVQERLDLALARGHAHLGQLGPADPRRVEAVAVLAHLLGLVGRDAQAYDAYLVIGRDVTALPWGSYLDPVAAFQEFRQDAIHARTGRH